MPTSEMQSDAAKDIFACKSSIIQNSLRRGKEVRCLEREIITTNQLVDQVKEGRKKFAALPQ